jgi:TRAP-type C4-dicarboxylate transport system permease small subunit
MPLIGWSGGALVEFAIVIVLAIIIFMVVAGLFGWEYVHDKLRREKKEDAK